MRRLTSFCTMVTASRKVAVRPLTSVYLTEAWARLVASSAQAASGGSMIRAPMAPLLLCLIGSEEIRLVAPNSIGVAVTLPSGLTRTSPAYHW